MKIHIRRTTERYMALCGQGYAWPSTIAFERAGRPATCSECIRIADELDKEN